MDESEKESLYDAYMGLRDIQMNLPFTEESKMKRIDFAITAIKNSLKIKG